MKGLKAKMKAFLTPEEFWRFVRFSTVGVLNTGVDWVIFFVTTGPLHWSVYAGQILSYCTATIHSYLWNRYFTFRKKGTAITSQAVRFICVNLCSLGVSLLLLAVLHDWLGLNKLLSKIGIAVFTICINYLGNRFWVFVERSRREKQDGTL